MSDLFWLTDGQIERLWPFFPKSDGEPRVDDRRVLNGVVVGNRNGRRGADATRAYGAHQEVFKRVKRLWQAGRCSPAR